MLLEIRRRTKVSELMRRHVDADMPRDGFDDLLRERGLALLAALLSNEKIAIHVGAKARQDVAPIPPKSACDIVGDLGNNFLPLGLRVPRWNVKD